MHDASWIDMASGQSPDGPWTVLDDPFTIREDSRDDWHLLTGPIAILLDAGDLVMLYNGATADALADQLDQLRSGLRPRHRPWAGADPVAAAREGRAATDIAFAASTVVQGDAIALYYSLEDRILRRAMVRRYG